MDKADFLPQTEKSQFKETGLCEIILEYIPTIVIYTAWTKCQKNVFDAHNVEKCNLFDEDVRLVWLSCLVLSDKAEAPFPGPFFCPHTS